MQPSAPPEGGSDLGENRFDHMRVVFDAKLVGNGQEESVCLGNCFIRSELLDKYVRLGSISAPEYRPRPLVDEPDLIFTLTLMLEVSAVSIADERNDAAADRNTGLARMPSFLPGRSEGSDLGGLLDVEGLSGFVVL
jgi:hypothetical protein